MPGNESWFRETPLHAAAKNDHLAVCKLIIESAIEKNPKDSFGRTPLHLAAMHGRFEICQLILDQIDNKSPVDNWKRTPYHCSISSGYKELSKLWPAEVEITSAAVKKHHYQYTISQLLLVGLNYRLETVWICFYFLIICHLIHP